MLIVNPSSGGGRGVDSCCRGRGGARRAAWSSATSSPPASSTASTRPRTAARGGRDPVVMSGDGLIGQVGGALAGDGRRHGDHPRRARQRPRPRARDPQRDRRRPWPSWPPAPRREIDVGEVNGRRFLCIASMGFDSDANRHRQRDQARQGEPRLRLRGAADARGLEARDLHGALRRVGEPSRFSGYSVAAANSRAFGGGMFIAPDAELDDGQLRRRHRSGEVGKMRFLANLPKVFKGTHVEEEEVDGPARGDGRGQRRPPLRGLRRRRAPDRPAREAADPPRRAAGDRAA